MKPVVTNVIAGLLGMTLGWVVVGDPLSAMFAPTQVTWAATSCPPGAYNITSTAWNMSTGESHAISSPNVTLPRDSVVQVFPNLPAGSYSVIASSRRANGDTFSSSTQVLTGFGDPSGTAGTIGPPARSRPPSTPMTSRAVPRRSGDASPTSGLPRVGAPPSTTPRAISAKGTPRETKLAPSTNQASPFLHITVDADGNLVSTDANWQRVVHTDLDADGRFDVVTIELVTGDVWIIHLKKR